MNTPADNTKFFLTTEDYLSQQACSMAPPPPFAATHKAEPFPDTSVIYNSQEDASFGYVGYQEQGCSTFTNTTDGDVCFQQQQQQQQELAPSASAPPVSSSSSYTTSSEAAAVMAAAVAAAPAGPGAGHFCQPDTPISCCTSPAPFTTASPSPITPVHPPSDFFHFAKDTTVAYDQHQPVLVQSNSTASTATTASTTDHPTSPGKRLHRPDDKDDDLDDQASAAPASSSAVSNSELRRQIHIQSEQKRRAQIKDGFEDLRNELPSCLNKKMSKVALLHRTVQHIQHLKSTQMTILAELERLVNENEQLRKFQQCVLQKQALEKMYQVNNNL